MKIYFSGIILSILMLFNASVFAQNTSPSVADVKTQLISQMQKDGYLSDKMAREVSQKYITSQDIARVGQNTKTATTPEVKAGIQWSAYLSWMNLIKVIGVILLLVAFAGFIKKIIVSLWLIIASVPVILYQLTFLSFTLYGTYFPENIWQSQAFYIALFCGFANIVLIGWIVEYHKKLQLFLANLFNIGVPIECVISFWMMLYFAALAFLHHSSIFGFFAAVALSGVFSFSLLYSLGVLTLHFKENMLSAVAFGHLLVLGIYTFIYVHGYIPEYTQYFHVGIQYYCTIALGVALLVGASPYYKDKAVGLYVILFILMAALATFAYFFWDLKVVASIILCFFVLFALEWIGYIGYQGGFIFGTAVAGGVLYGVGLLLEKYSSIIILSLN